MNSEEKGCKRDSSQLTFSDHEMYMRRCFKLAQLGNGQVSPNPMVGALVVHEKRIIGQGFHAACGEAHAEVNALNSVRDADRHLIPQSRIYVSLEPCNHYGKTPPCTEFILRSEIRQLIYSCCDPNPIMAGKSIAYLSSSGVRVIGPILENEGLDLIRAFRTNILQERPYVLLKFAQTADFYMGLNTQRIKISNSLSDLLVHKWRAETDALVIGKRTLLTDNPLLTTRLWLGKNPVRIVLGDLEPQERKKFKIFEGKENVLTLSELGQTRFIEPSDFLSLLWKKYKIGVVTIEGGATTLQSFYSKGLWDEARVITNKSMILGEGIKAPSIKGILEKKITLENDEICYIRKESPDTLKLI